MNKKFTLGVFAVFLATAGVAGAKAGLFDICSNRSLGSGTNARICDLQRRLTGLESIVGQNSQNDLQTQIQQLGVKVNALQAQVASLTYQPAGDLIGYWKLDETVSGTAADSSGSSNDGASTGTSVVTGMFGKARQFNGTSDLIAVSDNVSQVLSSTGTVALWVKSSKNSGQGFVDKSSCVTAGNCGNQDAGFALYEYAGKWTGSIGNGSQSNSVEVASHDDGSYHHLVLRWDGSSEDLFIDGVLAGSTTQTIVPSSNGSIHIGFSGQANGAQGNGYLQGDVDEVRVYKRALNNAEVLSLKDLNGF
ncbi:MAG: LamG domain-containing protein [Patescibacteria group bacterium]